MILDSLTNYVLLQLYFHTIYQIQITINHDVKWIGWLAWVILYSIPILEKLNKLINEFVYTAQKKHLRMISLLQRHNQKITV